MMLVRLPCARPCHRFAPKALKVVGDDLCGSAGYVAPCQRAALPLEHAVLPFSGTARRGIACALPVNSHPRKALQIAALHIVAPIWTVRSTHRPAGTARARKCDRAHTRKVVAIALPAWCGRSRSCLSQTALQPCGKTGRSSLMVMMAQVYHNHLRHILKLRKAPWANRQFPLQPRNRNAQTDDRCIVACSRHCDCRRSANRDRANANRAARSRPFRVRRARGGSTSARQHPPRARVRAAPAPAPWAS